MSTITANAAAAASNPSAPLPSIVPSVIAGLRARFDSFHSTEAQHARSVSYVSRDESESQLALLNQTAYYIVDSFINFVGHEKYCDDPQATRLAEFWWDKLQQDGTERILEKGLEAYRRHDEKSKERLRGLDVKGLKPKAYHALGSLAYDEIDLRSRNALVQAFQLPLVETCLRLPSDEVFRGDLLRSFAKIVAELRLEDFQDVMGKLSRDNLKPDELKFLSRQYETRLVKQNAWKNGEEAYSAQILHRAFADGYLAVDRIPAVIGRGHRKLHNTADSALGMGVFAAAFVAVVIYQIRPENGSSHPPIAATQVIDGSSVPAASTTAGTAAAVLIGGAFGTFLSIASGWMVGGISAPIGRISAAGAKPKIGALVTEEILAHRRQRT